MKALRAFQISDKDLRTPMEDSFLVLSAIQVMATGDGRDVWDSIENMTREKNQTFDRFQDHIHIKPLNQGKKNIKIATEMNYLQILLNRMTKILFDKDKNRSEKASNVHAEILKSAIEVKNKQGSKSPLLASLIEVSNFLFMHYSSSLYSTAQLKLLKKLYNDIKLSKSVSKSNNDILITNSKKKVTKKGYIEAFSLENSFLDITPLHQRVVFTFAMALNSFQQSLDDNVLSLDKLHDFYQPFLEPVIHHYLDAGESEEDTQTNKADILKMISQLKMAMMYLKVEATLVEEVIDSLQALLPLGKTEDEKNIEAKSTYHFALQRQQQTSVDAEKVVEKVAGNVTGNLTLKVSVDSEGDNYVSKDMSLSHGEDDIEDKSSNAEDLKSSTEKISDSKLSNVERFNVIQFFADKENPRHLNLDGEIARPRSDAFSQKTATTHSCSPELLRYKKANPLARSRYSPEPVKQDGIRASTGVTKGMRVIV